MRLEVEQEEDGRWLAEAMDLPGVLAYGASREDAIAKVDWPCVSWRIVSKTARERRSSIGSFPRRERLAVGQGQASAGGLNGIGWTGKRRSGSHRVLERQGWPDFVFAFHDGEEIGPRMLARLARATGLTPDDL